MSSIRTIRWLSASTTKILPAVSTKIPPIWALEQLNWLAPDPGVPRATQPAPVMSLIRTIRQFLESEVPYLESILAPTVDEVLAHAEVVVVANLSRGYRDVAARMREGQTLIDLVRIQDGAGPRPKGYVGLSW